MSRAGSGSGAVEQAWHCRGWTDHAGASRHIEHTQVLHSARSPPRMVPRSACMLSLFNASGRSPKALTVCGPDGADIKKHGCTLLVAPTTA